MMMLPAAAVLFISCCTIIDTSQSFSPPVIIIKRISFHTAYDGPGGRKISSPLPSGGILPLMMSNAEYPDASDGEALQALFNKFCNGEGLMTEDVVRNVPAIKDMLVSIYTFIYFQLFMHNKTFVSASHIYHILQFRNKAIYYHQNFQKYGQLHLNFLKL